MPKLVHWEIPSTDLAKSKRFYAELFGWELEDFGPEYAMFSIKDGVGGGIMKADGVPDPCIRVYISTDDIPGTLAKAEALGATTVDPKTDIGEGMGYWASFRDPCGCLIGIHSAE